ncbi:class I SAM-dependent methyltransferase [Nostoc sp. UHCC 0702]|nr:class I SAM-dependent methyltransferase [Nostoc sp. UHCC 0702]
MSNEVQEQVSATIKSLEDTARKGSDILSENESVIYNGQHYDLIYDNYYPIPNLARSDIPFWLDIASQYGDPILELSCGTGRLAVPLAEKGFQVTGIDLADSMLEVAKSKSSQVEWIKADMQNFDLGRKFPLILLPVNGIWHLLNLAALEACFDCIKKHLTTGGKFIIDTFNPGTKIGLDILFDSRNNLYSVYPDPLSKGTVVVTSSNELDLTQQIYKMKLSFKLAGEEKEQVEEMTYRLYFPQELEALLKYNGFKIEHKFGGYDRSPFNSNSFQQIIVCSLQH